MTLTNTTRVSIPSDTLINVLGSESEILSLKSERYFGLDEMGTRRWTVWTTSPSLQEAYDTLLSEYEVEPEILRKDMEDLLQKLVEQELVEIKGE